MIIYNWSLNMHTNQDFTADRTKYLGGSDIGAILGLSPFRTPLQVWQEKTGKGITIADSLPLRFGSFAEEFVASEYSRSTGFSLRHDESINVHPQHSFMCAHLDRLVFGMGLDQPPTKILECKTANPFARSDWGQVGTDEVPLSYLAQCAWYQAITGIATTDLAVLFGNSEFRIYEIQRDLALEELVIAKAVHFWNAHVLADIPPPPQSESDLQSLYRLSNPLKSIEASSEIMCMAEKIRILNSTIEEHESQVSDLKQRIMQCMGEAEVMTFHDQVIATWKAPKPSFRLDAKRLELAHPEIAKCFQIPIQNSRRFVIKEYRGSAA
jgi:putative phage-type endonuclease